MMWFSNGAGTGDKREHVRKRERDTNCYNSHFTIFLAMTWLFYSKFAHISVSVRVRARA